MSDSNQGNQFAHIISPHSVSVYGASVGHSSIADNAVLALSYDVTHKLYDILRECKTQMNVYRQYTLSTTVLNNVLQNGGFPKFYGHNALIPHVSVPNSDMSVLHLTKINLMEEGAVDTINVELESVSFIKGIYVSPILKSSTGSALAQPCNATLLDNVVKMEPNSEMDSTAEYTIESIQNFEKTETSNADVIQTVNRAESDYYLIIAQIILTSSEALFKLVLEDLRTNPRLGSVYLALLNLISNSVKYFKCVGKLIDRLLRTVEALLDNPFMDASFSYSVDDAVDALCTIVLEPKIANDCDDFTYRRQASYLLMRALNTWNISLEDRKRMLGTLKVTLSSPEKMSLKANYSALIMFCGLGSDVLDLHFWPTLGKYLNVLCSLDEIISGKRSVLLTTDICRLKSALLLVTGILYRNFWFRDPAIQQLHISADILLSEYFGESLLPVRAYAMPKLVPLFAPVSNSRTNKDAAVDIEKDYRNIQLYTFRKKVNSSNISMICRSRRHFIAYEDVFEASPQPCRRSLIIFNFIGSNQLDSSRLRRKKLDARYNVLWRGKPCRPFLKYERNTRCIKYCSTSRFSGDINLFI